MPTKIQQAVSEYGESFPKIIAGFGAMGYSKKLTGETLGYSAGGFHCALTTWGLHDHFKSRKDQRDECRGQGTVKKKKYSDIELIEAVKRTSSCKRFKSETGIALSTIVYRFGSWSTAKRISNQLVVTA